MSIIYRKVAIVTFLGILTACVPEKPPESIGSDNGAGGSSNLLQDEIKHDKNIMLRTVYVTKEWIPFSGIGAWDRAIPVGYKESESLKYYEAAIWEETNSLHLYAFDNSYDASPKSTPQATTAYRESYRVMKFDGVPSMDTPEVRSRFLKNSFIEIANYLASQHPDAGHHVMYSGHGGPGGALFGGQLTPDDAAEFLQSWTHYLGRKLGVIDMGGPCNKGSYLDVRNFCDYADYYIASDLSNGGYTYDNFTIEKFNETSLEIQYHQLFKNSNLLRDVFVSALDKRRKRYEYSRNNMITNKVEQSSYLYSCKNFSDFRVAFQNYAQGRNNYWILDDMLTYLRDNNASNDLINQYHGFISYKIDNRDFFSWEKDANGLLMLYPSKL